MPPNLGASTTHQGLVIANALNGLSPTKRPGTMPMPNMNMNNQNQMGIAGSNFGTRSRPASVYSSPQKRSGSRSKSRESKRSGSRKRSSVASSAIKSEVCYNLHHEFTISTMIVTFPLI